MIFSKLVMVKDRCDVVLLLAATRGKSLFAMSGRSSCTIESLTGAENAWKGGGSWRSFAWNDEDTAIGPPGDYRKAMNLFNEKVDALKNAALTNGALL